MTKDDLDTTLDALEQEVMDELNQDFSPDENPNKMFSAVCPHRFEGVAVLRVAVLVLTSDLSPIVDKMTV